MDKLTDAELVEATGYEICHFPPEPGEECEECKRDNVQLYFSGPADAGRYLCRACVEELHKKNLEYGKVMEARMIKQMADAELAEFEADYKLISEHIEEGHTHHCACRLVWGDGECECNKRPMTRKEQIAAMMEVQKGMSIEAKISGLKEFDRVEVMFLDAHTIHKAWVHFDEFKGWVKNEQVYVHVTGHYIEHNDKFLTICMGYGAYLGSHETDQIVDPFSIPIGAIMELYPLSRRENDDRD